MGFKEYTILAFIVTALCSSGLGVFIYLRLRQGIIHRIFVLFSLCLAVWSVFSIGLLTAATAARSLVWTQVEHVAVVFLPALFAHYIYLLLGFTKQKSHIRNFYLSAVAFVPFIFTPVFIKGSFFFEEIGAYYFHAGPLYLVFMAYFLGMVTYPIVLVVRALRTVTGYRQIQLRYILIGAGFGFIGGCSNFLPVNGILIPPLTPFGTFLVPVFYVLAAYATLKRHVMNVNVLMAKVSVYFVSYALVLAVPFFVGTVFRERLMALFAGNWWSVPFGIFIVSASGVPYLSLFVSRRAEGRVLQDQLRYQRTLKSASAGMTRIRDLDKLLRLTVHVISRSVGVTHASIFVVDNESGFYVLRLSRGKQKISSDILLSIDNPFIEYLKEYKKPILLEDLMRGVEESMPTTPEDEYLHEQMATVEFYIEKMKASLVIPSFVGNKLFGFLVLGEKLSGQIYTQEDIQVFTTLANQAALAIENAFFYEELQVAQAQLFQSEKFATMGQLAGGMAHEIHNPLTIVSGQSQILLDRLQRRNIDDLGVEDLINERQQVSEVMNSVIKEINRTSEITRRLLKHTTPSAESRKNIFSAEELVEEVLTAVGHQVSLEKMNIIKEYEKDVPPISAHKTQIQEVYLNIILNAVQLMNGEGALTLTVGQRGNMVEVGIRDTGPGIAKENLSKLFDPFYTARPGGTGLGLFLCQRIIREHRGVIEVESEVGVGTLFRVTLPVK